MGNTDIFEKMASRYDTEERINIARKSADAIRSYLEDSKDKQAMDFGCGTGLVGINLLEEFESILFVDSSQNMIHQMDQKIKDFEIKNANTLCFDFEKETSIDVRADYIFMAQVLLHIKDTAHILSRLYEILNEDGHLIIVDFDKNDKIVSSLVHNGFDQERLAIRMREIGFTETQFKTFYNGTNIFMNQDASMFVIDAKK